MEVHTRAEVVSGNFYVAVLIESQNLEIASERRTTCKPDFLFWGGEVRQ